MKILFVRHGEIDSNTRRIYSGRSQEPLNAAGAAQAVSVARSLKDAGISHLFCGPLLRVVETARHIGAEAGVDPVVLEAFNELVMGPWEGLSEDAVAEQYPGEWQIWNTSPAALRLPGRETLAQLQERALAGVAEVIAKSHGARQICVVSHVAVIRVLRLHAEHRSLDEYKKVLVPNATPMMLEFDEDRLP
jgi:broad specificity phosphatase PhoE